MNRRAPSEEALYCRVLGKVIKAFRAKSQMSGTVLAKKTGYSRAWLSRLETGNLESVSFYGVIQLSRALGINTGGLVPIVDQALENTVARLGATQDPLKEELFEATAEYEAAVAVLRHYGTLNT